MELTWNRKDCDKEIYLNERGSIAKRTATGEYILRLDGKFIGAYASVYDAKDAAEDYDRMPQPKKEKVKIWRSITDE